MSPLLIVAAATLFFVLLVWLPGRRKFHTIAQTAESSDITVIISEQDKFDSTLCVRRALEQEGVAQVFLVSENGFSTIEDSRLTVLTSTKAPTGWNKKRWGQQQALTQVATPYVLFLDNDIELVPFTACSMRQTLQQKSWHYLSLLPAPRLVNGLERTLLPLLMYFNRVRFPWIIPRRFTRFADVSSQCLLVQLASLETMNGMSQLADSQDDRHWAKVFHANQLKGRHRISHAARRHKEVSELSHLDLYGLKQRQGILLLLLIGFWAPTFSLFFIEPPYFLVIFALWTGILGSYLPTLRYYNLHPVKLLLFPGAILLLAWTALRLKWGSNRRSNKKWRTDLIEAGAET